MSVILAGNSMNNQHHYIYGLYDPRTDELRYVGKTDRLRERLQNQINDRSNTYRSHWIQELVGVGLLPIQRILETLPYGADWQSAEVAQIAAARAAGCRLTNCTDGGDGVTGLSEDARERKRSVWLGRKHRPETLALYSKQRKGRRHPIEHRERMSEIMRGREITWGAAISKSLQRLTEEQVIEIRRMLMLKESQYTIAARYCVHQGTISNIARGKSYADIPWDGCNAWGEPCDEFLQLPLGFGS